jgi:S1/P1 Nuclease
VQLFTREYPNGDRGGIEMCVRASLNGAPIELHRLWDGVITLSGNVSRIKNIAFDLLQRFSGSMFRELDHPEPQAWAKESYEIAVKIAYENGSLRGTPKDQAKDCRAVNAVNYLRSGYAEARLIANRRMYLAGYRLANLLRT